MNMSKKINVNSSSLVGLKAELLRKQTEMKNSKTKEDTQPKIEKPKVRRKKVKDRTVKTEPAYTKIEDASTLRKSKLILEAKTMLYEKLRKNDGNEGHHYLVDFARKSDSSDDEFQINEVYEDTNSDPEDDWVEYEDCFGRTRKCLRRDLAKMREKDDMVKRDIMKEPYSEKRQETTVTPAPPVPKKECDIEIMRNKWEEQMERLASKSDIHYQDVLFDEARAHGVGYYQFSQNEEERTKQQENLTKLRKETEQRQRETREVKDLKSKMELNRLRAATIRQRVRASLPAELTEDEESALRAQIKLRNLDDTQNTGEETNSEVIGAAIGAMEKECRTDNSPMVVEDKIKAFGELLGKRPKWHEMSQEEWVHKRRRDRLGEFAPVYENFRRLDSVRGNHGSRKSMHKGGNDPVGINTTGPEPTDLWETMAPVYHDVDHERKIEDDPGATAVSVICEKQPTIIENSKNSDENEIVESPTSAPANNVPPSFINSFVPRQTDGEPTFQISFVRSMPPPPIINFPVPPPPIINFPVPPPPIINFPVPPPSVTTPLATMSQPRASKMLVTSVMADPSDTDETTIIGTVSSPLMTDLSRGQLDNCRPRLIEDGYLNMISEIPLPGAMQFSHEQNLSCDPLESAKKTSMRSEGDSKENDNSEAIAAGLKYLRQKFEQKH